MPRAMRLAATSSTSAEAANSSPARAPALRSRGHRQQARRAVEHRRAGSVAAREAEAAEHLERLAPVGPAALHRLLDGGIEQQAAGHGDGEHRQPVGIAEAPQHGGGERGHRQDAGGAVQQAEPAHRLGIPAVRHRRAQRGDQPGVDRHDRGGDQQLAQRRGEQPGGADQQRRPRRHPDEPAPQVGTAGRSPGSARNHRGGAGGSRAGRVRAAGRTGRPSARCRCTPPRCAAPAR